jgi:acetoin utilization deacetylase AcuC-like enzyme
LGDINLTEADYVWATSALLGLAAECCEGRLVSVLEGGYNFDALGNSVAAHVGALMSAP